MALDDPLPIYFERGDHHQTIGVVMFKFSLSVTETVDLDEMLENFDYWENSTEDAPAHDPVQVILCFESSKS